MDILTPEEVALVRGTPEVGFLPDFIEWAGRKTDAPTYAIQTAALMALSLACGDVIKMPNIAGTETYLNLYIMLIGPSTVMRKTTVLNFATKLLPKLVSGKYVYILDDVSTQAFNKAVAQAGKEKLPILLNVDEVSGLFEVVKKKGSYLAGFDKVLMRCYDHTPVYVNRTNSSIEAEEGAFTAVYAASTPEPLMEVFGSDDVASGLLPRFLFFTLDDSAQRPRRSLMERMADTEAWEEDGKQLAEFLRKVAHNRVNATFIPPTDDDGNPIGSALYEVDTLRMTPEAEIRLDAIDEEFTDAAWHDEDGWGAIKGRGFWHVVKLAGLYAISRQGRDATVELIDVLRAAYLVEILLTDIGRLQDKVGSNPMERKIDTIVEYLKKSPKLQPSQRQIDIARRDKLTGRELRDIMQTMVLRGMITVSKNEQGEVLWVLK